jgi:hypothetical protein
MGFTHMRPSTKGTNDLLQAVTCTCACAAVVVVAVVGGNLPWLMPYVSVNVPYVYFHC